MAALQDTTALISELTSKLTELDSKVASYRLDMAAEYIRHSEEVLRSVPENVAYCVSQAIAASLANFPALYPPGPLSSSPSPTPTIVEEQPSRKRGSPPPILPHTSGKTKDASSQFHGARGPHDRDLEFQGLFTPTYLPLLEQVDRPLHKPSTTSGSPATTSSGPAAPAPSGSAAPNSSDSGSAPASSSQSTPLASTPTSSAPEAAALDHQPSAKRNSSPETSHRRRRPSPLRRTTNTSIDSTVSDSSSVKLRKSALRRFSGTPRTPDSPRDPRRVRFDFEGQEVLPSSSPWSSPPRSTSPPTSFTALKTEVAITATPAPAEIPEIPYVTSLLDVKGEEEDDDSVGLPKKVSSTQALRALSKAPLDEGTTWTIVNTESASDLSSNSDADKVRNNTITNSSSFLDTRDTMCFGRPKEEVRKEEARSQTRRGLTRSDEEVEPGPSQARPVQQTQEDDEDSDDEDNVLFMMPKKGGQKPTLPVSSKAASRKMAASSTNQADGAPASSNPVQTNPVQANIEEQNTSPSTGAMPIPTSIPVSIPVASSMSNQAGIVNQGGAQTSDDASMSFPAESQATVKARHKKNKAANRVSDGDEAVFDFDDRDFADKSNGDQRRANAFAKYMFEDSSSSSSAASSSDSESEGETAAELSDRKGKGKAEGLPNSPPIDIVEDRRPITPEHRVPKKCPRKPAGSLPRRTSIGTFDGRPVSPHVVKDKKLRALVKSQEGEVPFFVGSIDGNSGVDASNIKSYQATTMSVTTASGGFASGSFAERMMWEKSQGVTYDSETEGRKPELVLATEKNAKKARKKAEQEAEKMAEKKGGA